MYIYWIRYEHHTDPHTQGYVGISNDPDRRFIEHAKYSKVNPRLKRAIAKGARMIIIKKVNTEDLALKEEIHYRPNKHIGWNIVEGGQTPPDQTGKDWSENKQTLVGEERTEAQKAASKLHSKRQKGKPITPKGGKLSENHRNALRGERPHTQGVKKPTTKCPHCGKEGAVSNMVRWHFDNCKKKGQ